MTRSSPAGVAATARRLALFPVHVGAVVTPAKPFEANPVLGRRVLNRLGPHVMRVVLAHAVMRFRGWLLRPLLDRPLHERCHRDGFLVLEDVLPADQFGALCREIRALARPNPFVPLPGFGTRWLHGLYTRMVCGHLRAHDDRARRRGTVAFYHRVPMARFWE